MPRAPKDVSKPETYNVGQLAGLRSHAAKVARNPEQFPPIELESTMREVASSTVESSLSNENMLLANI